MPLKEIYLSPLPCRWKCTQSHQCINLGDKANIELSFNDATAIDLAGRDVLKTVQLSVNPRSLLNHLRFTAVAKDGIQLIGKARVAVRANIRQLVGGAGEGTILARVGESIVTSIGSANSHKAVLEKS